MSGRILYLLVFILAIGQPVSAKSVDDAEPDPTNELAYYDHLAWQAYQDKDCVKVETYFNKTLEIRLKIFGQTHDEVLTAYDKIGKCWRRKGEHEKSLVQYEKLLELCEIVYHDNYLLMAAVYELMGEVLRENNRLEQALEMYRKAQNIFLIDNDESNYTVANTYQEMAEVLLQLERRDEAVLHYEKALDTFTRFSDVNDHRARYIIERIRHIQPNHPAVVQYTAVDTNQPAGKKSQKRKR
ncbi:MAG: tetratricopeptide repeat protein [Gammaproteobacteria bacterium]|nr:tetratricopeptide repeat protein [Gammaproteobacteria bacterium]MDH5652598.1 tetratricopeptide repeat protein [Gammaproteobacteria bacterium]